jgi:hypothetical protein
MSKSLIRGFAKSEECVCEEYFALKDNMCFVFPYIQERPLFRFYVGNIKQNSCSRQQIWLDIVTQCMTKKLPDDILNLIIKQGQINIAPDGSIDFGYLLDLSDYKEGIQEKTNVTLCAKMILELIYIDDAKSKDPTVLLLEKKLKRSKYDEFIQLFKDIKIIMQDNSDISKIERVKLFIKSRQDVIYRIMCVICIVLVCIVVVEFLGRLVLKDFSFLKIFTNSLKQIGTQSLVN